jgi:hypothetical protein
VLQRNKGHQLPYLPSQARRIHVCDGKPFSSALYRGFENKLKKYEKLKNYSNLRFPLYSMVIEGCYQILEATNILQALYSIF